MRYLGVGVAVLGMVFFLSGCAALLIGAGAAGGYALSADSIQGNFDSDFDTVWFKSIEVMEEVGQIIFEDEKSGIIRAKTSKQIDITITLGRVTENTTSLTVKAKKNVLPKRKDAQKIFSAIIRRI